MKYTIFLLALPLVYAKKEEEEPEEKKTSGLEDMTASAAETIQGIVDAASGYFWSSEDTKEDASKVEDEAASGGWKDAVVNTLMQEEDMIEEAFDHPKEDEKVAETKKEKVADVKRKVEDEETTSTVDSIMKDME
eukprot:scaffold1221_cov207-Amphora_coffeaeformis.AAC.34